MSNVSLCSFRELTLVDVNQTPEIWDEILRPSPQTKLAASVTSECIMRECANANLVRPETMSELDCRELRIALDFYSI